MFRWAFLAIMLIPSVIQAEGLATVCPNELWSWIRTKHPLSIVDIQSVESFRAHNYEGAIAAGSDAATLEKIAVELREITGKVIVVSATGGPDAKQAAEYLVRGGVQRSRIVVIEGGMEAAAEKVACDCCAPASGELTPQ